MRFIRYVLIFENLFVLRYDNKIKEMTNKRDNDERIIDEKIKKLKEEKKQIVCHFLVNQSFMY